jgi:hypothetical protein
LVPVSLNIPKSENYWFWFFEKRYSDSKNHQFQLFQKPERIGGFL